MLYGLPEGTDARDLIAAGAVGDLLDHYLDAEASLGTARMICP
ncbi:hypothetical protein [Mesorhizobium ventifaucium]|uniref:Uncharacterized protein n=1 Tax=Mesorhizobium ventifaucium TaxID=666020 RepID=A0ABM9E5V4_9HYPH|nr:hypothetical protein [Mesorhizobium ventifaucium]CAH2404503.1 hypothetical protein MES4922_360132 [Mesorhizobium ventifaucium]